MTDHTSDVAQLTVTIHDGLGDAALRAAWDALAALDPAATLFQRARWLARWDEVLAGPRALRLRTFHDGDRLVGILAETRELQRLPSGPQELLRMAGGDEVTDYLGPVSLPTHRAAVARAYAATLVEERGWDEVVLTGLAEDTGWPASIAVAAREAGLRVSHDDVEDVCPRVDLAGGRDAYLSRLPGRMRQEMTRKARKLARDVGEYEVHTYAPDETATGIEDFLAQVVLPEDEKSTFFRRPEMQQWFRTLAEEYAADGTLRVHRLDVGGLPAAMTVSLVDVALDDPGAGRVDDAPRTWGLYNSSFDPTLAALSPGVVLVWELIGQAADDGFEVFDLLRGDEAYKYRFGAVDRAVRTLTLMRG
jgi:CelD/BcsL family acetyltransferase involved in cellulose biosynthesis